MKLLVLQYQKLHPEIRDFDTVTVNDFQDQLSLLKEHEFNPITCNDIYNYVMKIGVLPSKPVLITFDDGYVSQYEQALPVLKESGFHAAFFVSGGASLKSCYRQNDVYHSCMNIEQLKQLQKLGFEIGLHGYDHIDFSQASAESMRSDLQRATMLFEKLNLPITKVLAYPYGSKPRWFWRVRKMYKMLKQEKILLAFSKNDRSNDLSDIRRFNICRAQINGKQTQKQFIHLFKKHK